MKTLNPRLPPFLRTGLIALLLLSVSPAIPESSGAAPAAGTAPVVAGSTIRIVAGLSAPLTDETGKKWLPSHDFLDGDTMDRPELSIANTQTPSVYRSERYGMTRFVRRIPNGNYLVKLHFAVTYEAIDGPRQCVFSFDVEGRAFNDFDLFVRAGGALKAYVESIPVAIRDGDLEIKFTGLAGNPTISAIEIIPQP
jgi:hypothetical protein